MVGTVGDLCVKGVLAAGADRPGGVMIIYPTKDAYIVKSEPNKNYGASRVAQVGYYTHWVKRYVVEWKLPKAKGTISKVELFLYSRPIFSYLTQVVNVHILNQPFVENEVCWNKCDKNHKWATPGGDFNNVVVAHYKASNELPAWHHWTLMGREADNPLKITWGDTVRLMIKTTEKLGRQEIYFTREAADNAYTKPYRPYLRIQYGTGGADKTPPTISNVRISTATNNTVTISWITDEPSTSLVEYGITSSYGSRSVLNAKLTTSHKVRLTNLENKRYHYRVISKDASHNEAKSRDYLFTLPGGPDTISVPLGGDIERAINALPPTGGKVSLAKGEYRPMNSVKILNKHNIILEGNGAKLTYGEGAFFPAIYIRDSTNITIRNLHLDRASEGIIMRNVADSTISKVRIENGGRAIGDCASTPRYSKTEALRNITIEDCVLLHNSCNILIRYYGRMKGGVIRNNEIGYARSWMGIDLQQGCSTVLICNNVIHHSANGGFKVYSGSSNHVFRDNLLYANQDGVWIMGGNNNRIVNNIIRNNRRSGILICGPYSNDNTIIKNNRIYANGKYGILLAGDKRHKTATIDIESNTIFGHTSDGIRNPLSRYTLRVKNNIITNNGGYGINEIAGIIISSYNNIWKNRRGSYNNVALGTGDISAAPLFADPSNGDFHLKSKAGRWDRGAEKWVKDKVHSPCIDAGDPKSEYKNEPKPNGSRINMGAYGNTPEASRSSEG